MEKSNFIPLVNLKAQWQYIKDDVLKEMNKVLESTSFILGDALSEFEKAFANYIGVKHAVGVASGTDALHLALRACEIKPGDEVITTNFTFCATVLAILMVGAKPVLVDINPTDYNIDISKIEQEINERTKAIIPVHLYGYPCNMDELMQLASKHKLIVIEDACQAHGAAFKNKKVGGIGNIGCFSFYPGKNLGCFGDGGMITTNDDFLFDKLTLLRNYGQRKKYEHLTIGYNSRLDTLQAAILNVKLKYLDNWNTLRRKAAQLYRKLLEDTPLDLPPLDVDNQTYQVYHLFVVRTKVRDKLLEFLNKNNIGAQVHYPKAINELEAFKPFFKGKNYPISEEYAREVLSLPLYPEIRDDEIRYICDKVKEFYCNLETKKTFNFGMQKDTNSLKKLPSLSIIIPAFNEEATIRKIALDAVSVAKDIAANFEVLIVDDGSTDNTSRIIEELSQENPFIRTYHHPFNIGYGGAQKTGILISKYDYLTFIPADGQFDVNELRKFAESIEFDSKGNPLTDIIVGYRVNREDSLFRKIKTFIFKVVMRLFFGIKLRDVNWVKLFNKKVFDDIDIEFRGIGVDSEIIIKAKSNNATMKQIPVAYYPRTAGVAKGDKLFNILITLWELVVLWFRYVFFLTRRRKKKSERLHPESITS